MTLRYFLNAPSTRNASQISSYPPHPPATHGSVWKANVCWHHNRDNNAMMETCARHQICAQRPGSAQDHPIFATI